MARAADKVVLITGGSGGLGSAAGRRLAEEGAIVVLADVADDAGTAVAKEIGGSFAHLDVSQEDQWQAVVEQVVREHGRIDVLVNAAGIEGDAINGGVETTSVDEWHKVLAVNLDGTFLGCKHVLPVMRQAGHGSIVNISSIVSYMATPSTFTYGASKAAVMQLTKSVAITGSRDGLRIRCNSVHPGLINTRMMQSIRTQVAQKLQMPREQAEGLAMSRVPLGRIGEPDDVAYLILYLASDEASYVTGSEFSVDGGWSLGQAS